MTTLKELRGNEGQGPVRVLVELRIRAPRDEDVRHLEALGLTVEKIVRNKIVGVIAVSQLPVLEGDASVAAVERSRKLKLHDPGY